MRRNTYRRGSGPIWFVALIVVVFALYSAAIAAATADDCDPFGGEKTWNVLPPRWECGPAR